MSSGEIVVYLDDIVKFDQWFQRRFRSFWTIWKVVADVGFTLRLSKDVFLVKENSFLSENGIFPKENEASAIENIAVKCSRGSKTTL